MAPPCIVHEEAIQRLRPPASRPSSHRPPVRDVCACVSACGSGRRSRRSCATCRTSCASCRTCWTRACGRSTRPWRCTSWSMWCRPCCCPPYSTTRNNHPRALPPHKNPRPRLMALTGVHAARDIGLSAKGEAASAAAGKLRLCVLLLRVSVWVCSPSSGGESRGGATSPTSADRCMFQQLALFLLAQVTLTGTRTSMPLSRHMPARPSAQNEEHKMGASRLACLWPARPC